MVNAGEAFVRESQIDDGSEDLTGEALIYLKKEAKVTNLAICKM